MSDDTLVGSIHGQGGPALKEPVREAHGHLEPFMLRECSLCGTKRPLDTEYVCGGCRDAEHLDEWRHYARAQAARAEAAVADKETMRQDCMAELNDACAPLAIVLGFPRGPFPEICPTCRGGPCRDEKACGEHVEWGEYTAPVLAEMAAKRISKLQQALVEAVIPIKSLLIVEEIHPLLSADIVQELRRAARTIDQALATRAP